MGWMLIHDTYEAKRTYPIVTHVFRGETKEEAAGYHRSHRRTDSFMRQCEDRGVFGKGRDAFECRVEMCWRRF